MKILLVRPHIYTTEKVVDAPLALAILGGIARSLGHSVTICDLHVDSLPKERDFDIVGITGVDRQKHEIISIAEQFPSSTVVVGGPWATNRTSEAWAEKSISYVCVGEGEAWWTQFLRNYPDPPKTDRVWIKDLDALPYPDWSVVPYLRKYGRVPVYTSRGCPHYCIFCSVNRYYLGRHGWRSRKPENVVDEIQHIANHFGVKRFTIVDDNPTLDPERFTEICEGIAGLKLNLVLDADAGLRVDRLPDYLLDAMKAAGFKRIQINPESGCQDTLTNIIHKNLDISHLWHVAKYARHIGLDVDACFVIGFPHETLTAIKETIGAAHKLRELGCNAYVGNAMPLFHTELYAQAKYEGYLRFDGKELDTIIQREFGKERQTHTLSSPHWKPEEIMRIHHEECRLDRQSSFKRLAFTRRGLKKLIRDPMSVWKYLK